MAAPVRPSAAWANATVDELAAQTSWVRALARRLVQDPDVADDLAQEAVLIALRERERPASWRAWLTGVLRNLVRERRRLDERIRRRERRAAVPEATVPTIDLVEEMSAHREVVSVLLGMPEHYRDVLVRRYYRGETPTQIAAHCGVPISSVKTRLARGLQAMRATMDERHGSRRSWVVWLAPLGLNCADVRFGWAAGLSRRVVGAVAVLLVMAAGVVWLGPRLRDAGRGESALHEEASPASAAGTTSRAPSASVANAGADGVGGTVQRTTQGGDRIEKSRSSTETTGLAPTLQPILGRVVDHQGRALAHALLRFDPDLRYPFADPWSVPGTRIAMTEVNGDFQCEGVTHPGTIDLVREGWATLYAGSVHPRSHDAMVRVVAAQARPLRGTVTARDGSPVPEARLEWRLPEDLPTRLGISLERTRSRRWTAQCDELGRFSFEAVPRVEGASLEVVAFGHEVVREAVDSDQGRVAVTLGAADPDVWLRGRVVDSSGGGLPSAHVGWGSRCVATDARGRFQMRRSDATTLRAVAVGFAVSEREVRRGEDGVEVRLEQASLALDGLLVDEAGVPIVGAVLWIEDPSVLVTKGEAEDDGTTHWQSMRRLRTHELPPVAESLAAGRPRSPWGDVRTDEDGRFRLEGLSPRTYRVGVLSPRTGASHVFDAVDATKGEVSWTWPSPELLSRWEGRVTDAHGDGVGGVAVRVSTDAMRLCSDGATWLTAVRHGGGTRTQPDGRFRLRDVPLHGTFLSLSGAGILPCDIGRGEGRVASAWPVDATALVVDRRRRLRFDLPAGTPGATVTVVDAQGRRLPIHCLRGDERIETTSVSLVHGQTEVLSVPVSACEAHVLEVEKMKPRVITVPWVGAEGVTVVR